MKDCTRRSFINKSIQTAAAGAAVTTGIPALLRPRHARAGEKKDEKAELEKTVVEISGCDPASMTKAAIKALGGIEKFVKKKDVVVVKPNIAWNVPMEMAGNTNPEVVAEVVRLCKEAGAKKVLVFDLPCNNARRTYVNSGIAAAAKKAGAEVSYVNKKKFREVKIPDGIAIKKYYVYGPLLDADKFINVPIAKHHSIATLTMCFKNLMGVVTPRGKLHWNIHQKLVDLATILKPDLNILDCFRIMIAGGPKGGRASFVRKPGKVLAGVNMASVDAYGVTIFNKYKGWKDKVPTDIGYIKRAGKCQIGEIDLDELKLIKQSQL